MNVSKHKPFLVKIILTKINYTKSILSTA